MKRTILILVCSLCSTIILQAQVKKAPAKKTPAAKQPAQKPTTQKSKILPPIKAEAISSRIHSVARASKNEILIRWAPSDEGSWSMGNKYGYAIERFTIVRDGKVVNRGEEAHVKMTFKPRPLQEWDTIANNDDNAAVMAQAIYGDDFDVEMTDTSGVMNIINQTEKLAQRFTMSMYAADQSFEAAIYAGLGLRDRNVKENEKYFYRVYSLIPKKMRITDTALLYLGPGESEALPKPSMILPQFGDKAAMLTWDFDSYREHYTSYIVERSADGGKNFEPVSPRAVTKLNESDSTAASGSVMYIDALPGNDTVYHYRIAGKSLFGETGPYSEVVSGHGVTELPFTPHITGISLAENGNYLLNWEFEDSLNSQVKEFQINQSSTIQGPYIVQKSGVDASNRSVDVSSQYASNYYTITVIPKSGEPRTSMPYLLQPEDSIAPAIPEDVTAIIDSAGVVTLHWKANPERDLAGYKIFKTDVKGNEFTPVMDSLWQGNEYRDTVELKNLNRKLYYAVRAVDHRYNQSDFSPVIEVEKPDVIAPTSPVLAEYTVSETGIILQWVNSSAEDVALHRLYRRQLADTVAAWTLMQEFIKGETQWIDKDAQGGFTYSYTLVAVDKSSLESVPAVPLTITMAEGRVKTAVKKLDALVDRKGRTITLNWQQADNGKNVRRFELYRGADKEPMSLYKQLSTADLSFVDSDLRVNSKYRYAIRAVYANGKYSDFVTKQVIY